MVSCYECGTHFSSFDGFRHHCKSHVDDIVQQFQYFCTRYPDFDGIRETVALLDDSLHIVTKAALVACAGGADTAIEEHLADCVLSRDDGVLCLSVDDITNKVALLQSIHHPATDQLADDMDAIIGLSGSCWELNTVAATVLHFCDAISLEDALLRSVENHYAFIS